MRVLFRCYFILCICLFTLRSSDGNTGDHIKLQREPNSGQPWTTFIFVVLFRTFWYYQARPPTLANCYSVRPSPGYPTGAFSMLQRKLKSGQVRRKLFCLLYFYFATQDPAAYPRNQRSLIRFPIPQLVHKFSIFCKVFGGGWLAAGSNG